MSTLNAKSTSKVLELSPWILIWFSEMSAVNLSIIVCWDQVFPMYSFPTSIDWNHWKACNSIDWNLLKQTDCDSVHHDDGCEDPTSIDWNCWKACNSIDWNLLKQTDCDSVHHDDGCEGPTSIDWNYRKARKFAGTNG